MQQPEDKLMSSDRHTTALRIAREAGTLALDYYRRVGELNVISKGTQDFVTEADRNVEDRVRELEEKARA